MTFSKSFPRTKEKYTTWEEVYLTSEEEKEAELLAKEDSNRLMKECIDEAKEIFKDKGLKDYQTDIVRMAVALFEKRASHVVYHKESKVKDKFDQQ